MPMVNKNRLPNIVAIGGGTGLSAFLNGMKNFPVNISAIVTVADDGGSSGILREDLKMPPPGDIRNVLVSLSNSPEELQELLQFRFEEEEGRNNYLVGHPVGNLMLAALTQILNGDFNLAVKKMGEMLNVKGKVLPVSHNAMELCGRCIDGTIVKGESSFVNASSPLKEVFYEERLNISPGVIKAIREADVVVLGPGSLYTSVIPNIIIPEVAKTILENEHADIVYICNIMTELGETEGYTVDDHVDALKRHGISMITKVIVNDQPIPANVLDAYEKENAQKVIYNEIKTIDYEVVFSRIAQIINNTVRHDSIKTAATIYSIAIEHR